MKEVFDEEVALQRLSGKRALLAKLARMFVDGVPDRLRNIRVAIDHGDATALEHTAHSLKSSAAALAGEGVREVAWQLETCGHCAHLDGCEAAYASLEAEVRRLVEELGHVCEPAS